MLETITALIIMACPSQGESINPNAIYMCAEKTQPKQIKLLTCTNNLDPNLFYNCANKVNEINKNYKWVKVKTKWIKIQK